MPLSTLVVPETPDPLPLAVSPLGTLPLHLHWPCDRDSALGRGEDSRSTPLTGLATYTLKYGEFWLAGPADTLAICPDNPPLGWVKKSKYCLNFPIIWDLLY